MSAHRQNELIGEMWDKFKRQHAVEMPLLWRNNEILGPEQIDKNMVHYDIVLQYNTIYI